MRDQRVSEYSFLAMTVALNNKVNAVTHMVHITARVMLSQHSLESWNKYSETHLR